MYLTASGNDNAANRSRRRASHAMRLAIYASVAAKVIVTRLPVDGPTTWLI
jgi:hypothetical protein